jgi:hypothetical protein
MSQNVPSQNVSQSQIIYDEQSRRPGALACSAGASFAQAAVAAIRASQYPDEHMRDTDQRAWLALWIERFTSRRDPKRRRNACVLDGVCKFQR